MPLANKLTPCCTDATCKSFRRTVEFLQSWGLDTSLKRDRLSAYFEIALPDYWSDTRRQKFKRALRSLMIEH
jgi:hypothetical protein